MDDDQAREALLAQFDQERIALLALLPRFTNEQWQMAQRNDGWTVHEIVAHLADSNYGMALMALDEIPATLPLDPKTGWMDAADHNQERRKKNAGLPRSKVMDRSVAALDQVHRAIRDVDDLQAPGPYNGRFTKGFLLHRIVGHMHEHRLELAGMLEDTTLSSV